MPRQARLDNVGFYHHVMGRGIDGLKIFYKETDKQDFLTRLKAIQQESSMQIHAWCIMDNHFHLLYQTGQTKLSEFMRKLLTGYAINYNKRNNRKGYLFQGRYKSIIIDVDEYYLPLVRYIHLNPVKAKIVVFSKLKGYAWTGHREIVAKEKGSLINGIEVLGYFGRSKATALKAYEEYLLEGIDKEDTYLLGGRLIRSLWRWEGVEKISKGDVQASDERILGGEDFTAKILNRSEQEAVLQSGIKNIDDLFYKIGRLYNIERDALIEMKTKEVRGAHSVFIYLAVKKLGMSVKNSGRVLKIKESAASSSMRKGMMIGKEKEIMEKLINIV